MEPVATLPKSPWEAYFAGEAAIDMATRGVSFLEAPLEESFPTSCFEGCDCQGGCTAELGCACRSLGAKAAGPGLDPAVSLFECHPNCDCDSHRGGAG